MVQATAQRALEYNARCQWSDQEKGLVSDPDDGFVGALRGWLDSDHRI
ncbi:MAG: hypothetical protein M3527_03660 [Actinomycetota bacterium]|nr:hypothetical protein [Acidimicrobiia bacterium]MDQ3293532.1 hypothetical protein [Actinomycetota bacterium]